jgi:hypothetical protein
MPAMPIPGVIADVPPKDCRKRIFNPVMTYAQALELIRKKRKVEAESEEGTGSRRGCRD